MTTYTIIPATDGTGFRIGVVGDDGARHTMLGFDSLEDAKAWIIRDKRLNAGTEAHQGQESVDRRKNSASPSQHVGIQPV